MDLTPERWSRLWVGHARPSTVVLKPIPIGQRVGCELTLISRWIASDCAGGPRVLLRGNEGTTSALSSAKRRATLMLVQQGCTDSSSW